MQIDLPYGRSSVSVDVPDHAKVVKLQPASDSIDIQVEIRRALNHPVNSQPLKSIARGFQDAVIVINDVTRPAPSGVMLEALLEDLVHAGITENRVTVVIANGNHRPCTLAEIRQMVGNDLFERLRIINHDAKDSKHLTRVGDTKTGLPVWANRIVANASLKILTGLITPHHSAGYSGGRKSFIPGVAGLETLKRHHSFPFRPFEPSYGWMKGNPFHEEAVRIARKAGINFILNVVQDSHGNFTQAVAGDLEAAHEKGVSMGGPLWEVSLPHPYDIVIASPGGFPRDIDLHQAQKAVSAAETMIESSGVIVLIAECQDGLGKWRAPWLKSAASPREVVERFKKEGFTEDHTSKDFMCARALAQHKVILFSTGVPEKIVRQIFFTPAASPQAAVDLAFEQADKNASVLVLPRAVNCVPRIDG
jgi:nickel-dependent lactate racemase